MSIPTVVQDGDIDLWVAKLSQLAGVEEIQRGMAQLEAAACQMRPRPWRLPYADQQAPFLPPRLPRDRQRMDEVYRDILVFFWQMYFPHYRVLLQRMASGQEAMSLEQHLQCVQGNWFAAVLALRFIEAHYSRFPQWNALWLRTQLEYLGKTTVQVAQEYKLPLWQVRLAAWWHKLAPVRGWRGFLWALGLYKPPVRIESPAAMVEEQTSFADEVYVRPRGARLFVPAGDVL
jgi:hypothetical protein